MDDRTEVLGLPFWLPRSYFLSCWVSEKEESIPQWAMYAAKGVRICLPKKWYSKHPIPIVNHPGQTTLEGVIEWSGRKVRQFCPFPFEKFKDYPYKFIQLPLDENEGFCVEVEYTARFEDLKREAIMSGKFSEMNSGEFLPVKYKDILVLSERI